MNKKIKIILVLLLLTFIQSGYSQTKRSDANIFGHVICQECEEHLAFATLQIVGTTIGATTDETGHYQIINLPEGTYKIKATYLGHKPQELEVTVKSGETKELNFELERDALGLEEVVITGNRNESNRKESSTIVNTITPKTFAITQSVTMSEGLNFCPGLRTENNCQNCGFTQVRMNGMEGPYSQILINSRPIFSGLAGVYGLELIPSAMIERIEVIRGGGSALYGSNAIAGTVNLILKDPISNTYEFGINSGLTGLGMNEADNLAQDHSLTFNTSLVSSDAKTGMALYGFYRDREPFDANNDNFSEIASIKNTTIGTRLFHRFGSKGRITGDFFNIKENRRGGDKFDYPVHEANIAEALDHNITTAAITFERYFRIYDMFSIYASGQGVARESYYGAMMSLKDYGTTKDLSYTLGTQYNAKFGKSNIILGLENNAAILKDKKLGYPDIENAIIANDSIITINHTQNIEIAHQETNTIGVFSQYEIKYKLWQVSIGARYDNCFIGDNLKDNSNKTLSVLSPRFTFKYDIFKSLQARLSYSQGYRAPQIFDEDLHIETSGSRKIIHVNSTNLKEETSHSYMISFDFNKQIGKAFLGLLMEAFYTELENPFANEYSEPDENGTVIYTRINAKDGALVQGVNLEMNVIPNEDIALKAGFTVQSSEYEAKQEFDEKRFFRTPEDYGYVTFDYTINKHFGFSTTGNYTGKMLVPYFGLQIPEPEAGELRESSPFYDLGIKLRYTVKLNGASLQVFTGMKNIFNAYQNDFDSGIDRDPGYIYGPNTPRTVYAGIKIGNFIK